ncbi:MAG: glycosyltransferase [Candidatus Competibacteraceae bacterium]|nr:glycosyltransferase [Candidatus Competibacteraceae bacterium]
MKILVYAHRLEVGGTQVNAIELATALRDLHGLEVVMFAQPGPMVRLIEEKGLCFLPAPDARFHPSLARMRALSDAVRREKPDLIHAWDWWQMSRRLLLRTFTDADSDGGIGHDDGTNPRVTKAIANNLWGSRTCCKSESGESPAGGTRCAAGRCSL